MRVKPVFLSWVVLGALCGCAGMDRLHAKLDMAEQHLGPTHKPFYEGQLSSVQKIGPMTSLQFTDGQILDVSSSPDGLRRGDVVRVFQVDNAYEAHLWRHAAAPAPSAEASALAPLPGLRSK